MSARPSLRVILNSVDRAELVEEIADLVKAEIYAKRGLRGLALKNAYGLGLQLIKDIDKRAINYLLDDVIAALEPHYANYLQSGVTDVEAYFETYKRDIAKTLLGVVDVKASLLSHKFLRKIYKTFRPRIEKEVIPAVPKLGRLIKAHQ